jgi:hypothetical protein
VTPQQALRLQLILLVAANGKRQVLAALADALRLGPEELDAAIKELEARKASDSTRTQKDTTRPKDPLDAIVAAHPDKADELKKLNARFTNKAFLPEMRDVRRFMDDHALPFKNVKSRADALPRVLKVLGQLDVRELRRLCEQPDSREYSALGVISDEIMGRERR